MTDKPTFPSSQKRGGRDINKFAAKRPYYGADGVARSASPIGRSLNTRPKKLCIRAELTTLMALRYRARASRPSARNKVASRLFNDRASTPPLRGGECVYTAILIAILLAGVTPAIAQTPTPYTPPHNTYNQPDLNGIWQAMNTSNWDIEEHGAERAPYAELVGAYLAQPAGFSIVEGGTIPYKPEALEKRNHYRAERLHPDPLLLENGTQDSADPEAKCFQGGVPRATYMPYPFQILQSKDKVLIAYEYGGSSGRVVHLGDDFEKTRSKLINTDSWMGQSVGRFEGDTLVVDDRWFSHEIWLDRAGNFYSEEAHVTERYTPISPFHLRYEATIDDPKTFTRPWKLSVILYKHVEPNMQLLEFQCIPFAEDFQYGKLYKKKPAK